MPYDSRPNRNRILFKALILSSWTERTESGLFYYLIMGNTSKIKVGDTVYLKPNELGNAYRRDKSVKEDVVIKVGRKYVELEKYGTYEIESGRQKTKYSADYQMWLSRHDLEQHLLSEQLKSDIKNSIPKYGVWDISIEKLKAIADIIGISYER